MPTLLSASPEISYALAALPALVALLQLILARTRDLASVTVGIAGAVLWGTGGSDEAVVGAVVAAGIGAVASGRGAARGVGRPGLWGVAVAAVVLGGAILRFGEAMIPQATPEQLRGLAVVPCVLAAVVGGIGALERPGPRRPPTRWRGPIEVQEGPEG